MSARPTPFALVFGDLAPEWFPDIARAIGADDAAAAQRDRFVLLEPVGRLLQELAPDDAPAEAIEAYVRLVHHAYRHWAAGGLVYDVSERLLAAAAGGGSLSSQPPLPALYLRLPPLRVWGTARAGTAPEPLDGCFVTQTATPGAVAVLAVFGMHGERPGFSAVAVEGRADADRATTGEVELDARRPDGSAAFAPLLAGGAEAGVYSVADAGELLLLVCRLLPVLPKLPDAPHVPGEGDPLEHVVTIN
jgi:hypothetical protein